MAYSRQKMRAITAFTIHFVELIIITAATVGDVCIAFSNVFPVKHSWLSIRNSPSRQGCVDNRIFGGDFRISSQTNNRLLASKNLWSVEECLDKWNKQEANSTACASRIQFVDATWYHKGDRNGREEFEKGPRLPRAFHWDTGDMSMSGDLFPMSNPLDLKNVFPPEWMVGLALEKMGVTASMTLVVYGREGTLFAPRVWYLLKKYCRSCHVKILQGSLEEWVAKGGRIEDTTTKSTLVAKDLLEIRKNEDSISPLISSSARYRLVDKAFVERVVERLSSPDSSSLPATEDDESKLPLMMIDTRGSSFAKNGHIPGAKHIPYASLSLHDDSLTLKSRYQLEEILQEAVGKESFQRLRSESALLTCGTGVSVCAMALVLEELGCPEPWIYDGSWDEWGRDPSTPKIRGTG